MRLEVPLADISIPTDRQHGLHKRMKMNPKECGFLWSLRSQWLTHCIPT